MSGLITSSPRVGELSPVLGARPHVDHVLDATVKVLTRPEACRVRCVFPYGPRGNGKTVLMNLFGNKAREAGTLTITLAPENVSSNDTLISTTAKRPCAKENVASRLTKAWHWL